MSADPAPRLRCGEPTTAGHPCRNYAVEDGKCRVHLRRTGDGPEPATPRRPTGRAGATSAATPGAGGAHEPGAGPTGARAGGTDPAGATSILDALADALGDEFVAHLETVAEFIRKRFMGDYAIDEHGLDPHLAEHVLLPLLRPLYRYWFRVTSHGRDQLPGGGGLVVANHAGTLPVDGLMLHLDVWEATGRHPRELGADLVFSTPLVGHLARKSGVTRANAVDADALLRRGELVVVFPEGFKGLGKPFSDRYQLERFGRGGFVATALRAGVPIIPTAIVGSEEIYPLLWDARQVARALGLPYFPIVAQMLAMPVVGPLGLLPLPSKWSITYGEPIDVGDLGPDASEDPMVVFDLADRVRSTVQDMLTRTVMGRQAVFF